MLKTISLTEEERRQIVNGLNEISGDPYGDSFAEFYFKAKLNTESFPFRVRKGLENFKENPGSSGVLLIRGMPIDISSKPTPTVSYAEVSDKVVGYEKYLLTSASMIGEPIGFSDWHRGAYIQNLYPIRELEQVQCASNSVYLEMHTETAFRPNTPTHLLLLCLKKDPHSHVKTVFCDLAGIIDSMNDAARKILASPVFCFEIQGEKGIDHTVPKPIESYENGIRRLHYAEALTAIDEESKEILADLKNRILHNSVVIELDKGDLVVIDNRHVVHGRTAYSPRFDGNDRWLQRVLIGAPSQPDAQPELLN
ncbi:MAG: TauD/TfdA family dioxygenase [Pyrinomonadaceae bacterium]|nr:TauD/TfdA family dioxygenase [Pyrinomonadaceae bacterium]